MTKIVLIYPSPYPQNQSADFNTEQFKSIPNGVFSIASHLYHNNYEVKLIDCRLYDKRRCHQIIMEEVSDSFAVGFSVMTCQIKHALDLTHIIKRQYNIPVIWGGIHPTLFPGQIGVESEIDYGIIGEAENGIIQLIDCLINKELSNLENIHGLIYKKNGKLTINSQTVPVDVKKLKFPNYDLLEIEHYMDRTLFVAGIKKDVIGIDIHTSRGCPFQCAFCSNNIPSFKDWRPYEEFQVIKKVDELVDKYKINHIWFGDDFFFGNLDRVKNLIDHISQYGISWEANIRVSDFSAKRVNDECLSYFKKNKCWMLRMGIESGSPKILRYMKKGITIDQVKNAFSQCYKFGIIPTGFFMAGVPNETEVDTYKTIDLMMELIEIAPNALLVPPGIYRPYPGCAMYEDAVKLGFKSPQDLRDWSNYNFDIGSNLFINPNELPWIRHKIMYPAINVYLSFYINWKKMLKGYCKFKLPMLLKFTGKVAEVRLKKRIFHFNIEYHLFKLLSSIIYRFLR